MASPSSHSLRMGVKALRLPSICAGPRDLISVPLAPCALLARLHFLGRSGHVHSTPSSLSTSSSLSTTSFLSTPFSHSTSPSHSASPLPSTSRCIPPAPQGAPPLLRPAPLNDASAQYSYNTVQHSHSKVPYSGSTAQHSLSTVQGPALYPKLELRPRSPTTHNTTPGNPQTPLPLPSLLPHSILTRAFHTRDTSLKVTAEVTPRTHALLPSLLPHSILIHACSYSTDAPPPPEPAPGLPDDPGPSHGHASGVPPGQGHHQHPPQYEGLPGGVPEAEAGSLPVDALLDSVVKIFTVASSPNYLLPWQSKPQREITGSGFAISGRRILTNAHVVADQTYVLVRKHGSPKRYQASVVAVAHECDLALLRIQSTQEDEPQPDSEPVHLDPLETQTLNPDPLSPESDTSVAVPLKPQDPASAGLLGTDTAQGAVAGSAPGGAVGYTGGISVDIGLEGNEEEFWSGMVALEFGDIPALHEEVAVVGYPQGGDNISITTGVVSRVEPTQYAHSAAQLLAIQIDAAINPGNSGGPALMLRRPPEQGHLPDAFGAPPSDLPPPPGWYNEGAAPSTSSSDSHWDQAGGFSEGGGGGQDRGAAIRPEGLVAGVTFQNLIGAENIGYIIPIPIVRRFLEDAEQASEGRTGGTPTRDTGEPQGSTMQANAEAGRDRGSAESRETIGNPGFWYAGPSEPGESEPGGLGASGVPHVACHRFTGFSSLGVACQPLENEQLRGLLRVPRGTTGVVVNSVQPLSAAAGVLRKDDIITAIDDVSIANDGTVQFRRKERLPFDYRITLKGPQDVTKITILRPQPQQQQPKDSELQEEQPAGHPGRTATACREMHFELKLRPIPQLVPTQHFDLPPSYFIFAGLVFVPLTQPYLHEYGPDWYNTSPRRLCDRALKGVPSVADQEVVVLSRVLVDQVNSGFERLAELEVKAVNGREITNLRGLRDAVRGCTDEYLRLDLDDDRVVVVGVEAGKRASPRILRRYRVPRGVSEDLLTGACDWWEVAQL